LIKSFNDLANDFDEHEDSNEAKFKSIEFDLNSINDRIDEANREREKDQPISQKDLADLADLKHHLEQHQILGRDQYSKLEKNLNEKFSNLSKRLDLFDEKLNILNKTIIDSDKLNKTTSKPVELNYFFLFKFDYLL
jgi:transcriptional regulator with XRE-family HTH domain